MSGVRVESLYCPIPSPASIQFGLASGRMRLTEIGLERLCPCCHEFWPLDTEFWRIHTGTPSGVQARCRACAAVDRSERRRTRGRLDTTPPLCRVCGTAHDAAHPHELNARYSAAFASEHGRAPDWGDAIAHTSGLLREAAIAGLAERGIAL